MAMRVVDDHSSSGMNGAWASPGSIRCRVRRAQTAINAMATKTSPIDSPIHNPLHPPPT